MGATDNKTAHAQSDDHMFCYYSWMFIISLSNMFIIKANNFLSTNNLIKNQVRTVVPYILEQLTSGKIVKVKKINQQSKKRTREEWQDVKPKGEEKELKRIKDIELNDRLKSRPKDAQDMARRKLQSLQTALMRSGYSIILIFIC